MKISKIKMPENGHYLKSESVASFLELKKGGDECLLYDEEIEMRNELSNIHSYCRRHDLDFRPKSRRVEDGWAIWKT